MRFPEGSQFAWVGLAERSVRRAAELVGAAVSLGPAFLPYEDSPRDGTREG